MLVQDFSSKYLISNSLMISFDMLIDKEAVVNSSLEIDTNVLGRTLDCPTSGKQFMVPYWFYTGLWFNHNGP